MNKQTAKPALIAAGVLSVAVAATVYHMHSANQRGEVVATQPAVTATIVEKPGAVFVPIPPTPQRFVTPTPQRLQIVETGKLTLLVWPAAPRGFRLNVTLSANAYISESVWSSPGWRAEMCPGGRIPVRVWVLKSGAIGWQRAYTTTQGGTVKMFDASLPCERMGYTQLATAGFQLGPQDQFAVEYSPALMVMDGALPFGSLIDNRSQDPVSVPAILVRAEQLTEVSIP